MEENEWPFPTVEGLRVVLFGVQLTLVGLFGGTNLPFVGVGLLVSVFGLLIPR